MTKLHGLLSSVRALIDENFRTGDSPTVDVAAHIVMLGWKREVDIRPLIAILDEGMNRCAREPDKSDAWLAPRVHASLRLGRREAADRRIWNWLNIVAKPDYVRWRFGGEEGEAHVVAFDRFVGEDSKNAIGRLWWAAELTRNGKDYSETGSILRTSRFFTSWQPLDAMHHRAAAIAICRFAREFNDGRGLTDSQSQRLAKAFNLRLSTLALDALVPTPAVDAYAIEEWQGLAVDESKYFIDLPEGPDEEPVSDSDIKIVCDVLQSLADEIDLSEFKRGPRSAAADREEFGMDKSAAMVAESADELSIA